MPSNTYWGMQHINENMLCSIGMILTGRDISQHEILEIAILPLDCGLDIRKDRLVFHMGMKPERTDNIDFGHQRMERSIVANRIMNSKDSFVVADLFIKWFDTLRLATGKQIVPLAWNWPLESLFLRSWLGHKTFEYLFDWKYRDVLSTGNHLNDTLDQSANTVKYPKVTLGSMAIRHDLTRIKPENAITRAKLIMEVYKKQLAYRTNAMI